MEHERAEDRNEAPDLWRPDGASEQAARAGWSRVSAWVPVCLVLVTLLVLWPLDLPYSYYPSFLRETLILASLATLFIVWVMGRSFLARPAPGLILLGCGVLLFGTAGLMADLAHSLGPNVAVTIYNVCVWLGASCHLSGVLISLRPRPSVRWPVLWIGGAYLATAAVISLVVYAARAGWLPLFFIEGHGGTMLRQIATGSAAAMFLITAALLGFARRRSLSVFGYWYSLALVLAATGLLGIMTQRRFGSPMSWASRGAEYLGGMYMLVAAIASVRESRQWEIPLEEALNEAREQYEEMFELAADGALIHDFADEPDDDSILRANPAICALLGYSPQEMRGMKLRDIVAPEDRGRLRQSREIMLRQGVVSIEGILLSKDGRRIPVEIHSRCFRRRGRRMFVSIARDITARKRAEEALRESQALLRAVMEGTDDPIYVKDREGRVLLSNPAVAKALGKSIEEIAVKRGEECISDAATARMIREHDEAVMASGRSETFEETIPTANGPRTFLSSKAPYRNASGEIIGIMGISRDLTARKEAEEALRQSEERLKAIVSSTPDTIMVQDRDLRYTFVVNPQLGHSAQEMIGKTDHELVPREEADKLVIIQRRVIETGLGVKLEIPLTAPNGEQQYFEGCYIPEFDAAGQVDGLIGYFRNITTRRRAEQRLREAQKLESLGILAAGVAHDFNNLLVGVVGNASLAQSYVSQDSPAAELLAGIVRSGEQAANLTRQMLAYSGKGRFMVEPLDLSSLLPDFCALIQPSISSQITLHLALEPKLPFIEADCSQIQQAVANLILNAAEAIGNSAGMISVATGIQNVDEKFAASRPDAADLRAGTYVRLEVSDTGCGMDESTRARIFDPFFSTKFTGRGLGLAAVSGIVRAHKGAVLVNSAPGRGSCFSVLFPASSRQSPAAGPERSAGALQGSGTILVVDDEAAVRSMARKALEKYGYGVLEAESGPAAINLLARYEAPIAGIVLDLSLPDAKGEKTIAELRNARPGARILISSGYSEAESMRLFDAQPVCGFIKKPYTCVALAEKAKKAFEQASSQTA